MPETLIRPAGESDIAALAALYAEFHAFHVAGVPDRLRPAPGDESLAGALRAIFADPRAAIFVAVLGDEIVGLAEVYLREDTPHPLTVAHRYGYLQSLVVRAAYRGQGLGARLTATAEAWAAPRGATEMQLETWEFAAGPLPFYTAAGYRTLKRKLVKALPAGAAGA